MKPFVEKMLQSGLVDKATTKLMEQWGLLPEGAYDRTQEDALKNATRDVLSKLADDLLLEAEKASLLRETSLDLDRLRWPATVNIVSNKSEYLVQDLQCVMDRMGRYYFRHQDVRTEWFVPGYVLFRRIADGNMVTFSKEMITESQVLFINEAAVCVQVSTKPDA